MEIRKTEKGFEEAYTEYRSFTLEALDLEIQNLEKELVSIHQRIAELQDKKEAALKII